MTPMCSITNGQQVGWAAATVDCEGTVITLKYFDYDGVDQGNTLPADWQVCRPTFTSSTVTAIVEMTQAAYDALVSKDPNTLYVIIG